MDSLQKYIRKYSSGCSYVLPKYYQKQEQMHIITHVDVYKYVWWMKGFACLAQQ